jgi:polyhydroxybutyrate depolymerase
MPLAVAMHGWLGTGGQMARMSGLSEEAARSGVAVAYPDGNWRSWGVSPADGQEDAAFIEALVRDVSSRFPVDARRVYLIGFSNGGFMAQMVACTGRLGIAGIAVVASNLSEAAAATCKAPAGVAFLLIHGTDDPVVPYGGGPSFRGMMLSVPATVAFWASANRCYGPAVSSEQPSRDPDVRVFRSRLAGCAGGSEVEEWLLAGAGHDWPGGNVGFPSMIVGRRSGAVDAAPLILRFLLRGADNSRGDPAARRRPARERT